MFTWSTVIFVLSMHEEKTLIIVDCASAGTTEGPNLPIQCNVMKEAVSVISALRHPC